MCPPLSASSTAFSFPPVYTAAWPEDQLLEKKTKMIS